MYSVFFFLVSKYPEDGERHVDDLNVYIFALFMLWHRFQGDFQKIVALSTCTRSVSPSDDLYLHPGSIRRGPFASSCRRFSGH